MAHHHHDHHHIPKGDPSGALMWALALNGGFLIVEATIGWMTGSLALLSDAVHMVGDVAALALALGANKVARMVASPDRTFGYVRAETLGAFVNGLGMLVACGFLFHESIERLQTGAPEVAAYPVAIAGTIGLAINLGSAWHLHRHADGDLNVQGALIHMLADALGSVGAIIAAVALALGYPLADPIVALLITIIVLWSTWGLLRESTSVLLQFPPSRLNVTDVRESLIALESVDAIHELHVWTLDGQQAILSCHLVSNGTESDDVLRSKAERTLGDRFHISHATLQIETNTSCESPRCNEPESQDSPKNTPAGQCSSV